MDGPWAFVPRVDLGFLMFLQTCILAQIKMNNKETYNSETSVS